MDSRFRMLSGSIVFALCGLAALATPLPALADDAPQVARISVIRGDVDIKRADSGDTVAASINAPLNAGDYLTTGNDARAEVQFDLGNALRLSERSQTRIAQLDRNGNNVQVAQGTVELAVVRRTSTRPSLQTPAVNVRPADRGLYRVTVDGDGNTEVTVRSGRADISWAGGGQALGGGSTLVARGTGNQVTVQTVDALAPDSFDRWNGDRDRYLSRAYDRDGQYDITGIADLNADGRWVDVPSYGRVWSPNVEAGWAPYRDGRWAWEPYYGWTWVSYEPWGWAPYHYGRWLYANNAGWCWYPGAGYASPVYSPALVGFIGFGGPGFNLSIGFGNVGWVPLAPYEPYRPWWGPRYYGGGTTVVNNITNNNITNNYYNTVPTAPTTVEITRLYRNANVAGGVTTAGPPGTGTRRYLMTAVDPAKLNAARPITGALPVVPNRESLRFGERTVAPSSVPITTAFRALPPVTTAAPSFEAQRAAVRSVAVPEARRFTQSTTPAVPASQKAVTPAQPQRVQTFQQPASGPAAGHPARQSPWDRFPDAQAPARSSGGGTSRYTNGSAQTSGTAASQTRRSDYAQPSRTQNSAPSHAPPSTHHASAPAQPAARGSIPVSHSSGGSRGGPG